MRWRRLALGLVPTLPPLFLAAIGACSREPARLGLVLRAPLGLLDEATGVELSVFGAGLATCEENGHVSAIPAGDAAERFRLDDTGCPEGVAWCKDITLAQDGADKMFAVVATNAGVTLAEGCAIATIDQDPLEVAIKVQRYNPPPCCNDGVLQAGEQCDPGGQSEAGCAGGAAGKCGGIAGDAVCGCDCRANEILLSIDDTRAPGQTNGPPRSKSQLSMTFAPGNPKIAGALRAVYRSESASKASKPDIALRFLTDDLHPVSDPVPLAEPLLLPLACADVRGAGLAQTQTSPSIAVLDGERTGIVYSSDGSVPNTFDVWLVVHTTDGCRDECDAGDAQCLTTRTPVKLSFPSDAPGSIDPDLAGGPAGAALAVWTRNGHILGRIWTKDGALVPADRELEIATTGRHARVAGGPGGWLVVYEGAGDGDGDGIFEKAIGPAGEVGVEARVNSVVEGLQDQPDIAAFPDGHAVVVWRSAGDIYFQRYGADGAAVKGDQEGPLNTTRDGEQSSPAAAASIGYGDFFAVAWQRGAGEIAARFPGGSAGFLFNSVTGQNGDFVASLPSIAGDRRLPAVAIGGAGFVAIGWQDESDAHSGVYVRRFPLPTTR